MRTAHYIMRKNIRRQASYMSQWENVKLAEFLVDDVVRVFNNAPVAVMPLRTKMSQTL